MKGQSASGLTIRLRTAWHGKGPDPPVRTGGLDGSDRQPRFVVPSVRDNLAAARVPDGLAHLPALWCRSCAGATDSGTPIPPNDPDLDRLTARAQAARENPAAWLAMQAAYGDCAAHPGFAARFAHHLRDVWARGTAAVLVGNPARNWAAARAIARSMGGHLPFPCPGFHPSGCRIADRPFEPSVACG
jgi:hypothetical protein